MTSETINYQYNTGNPSGSSDVRDGVDDIKFLDALCNSDADYVNSRLGKNRITAKGFQSEATAAIQATGWFPVAGSFEAGGTITARNQVLWWEAAKSWYSWNGELPKTVSAGSTPATSGGFSPSTGWTDRTDATLRSQLVERPLYHTTIGLYGLTDCPSVKDYGAIGDGTYHPVQEWIDDGIFSDLAGIQFAYPKVTSLTQSIDWAATQACADVNIGGEFLAPKAQYVITDTVVVPKCTTMRGQGKIDIWADDTTKGTCYLTHGAGSPQRWTDIDGLDQADDTPMFVAGGPGVYFRNMALRSDTWSMGLFYPGVKQCGFSQILALGFTDACIYLDATWSGRNTTLKTLHPEIDADHGMNEFSGFDFYCRATGAGAFGIKIQGTTRSGDSVATATDWLWGWGGTSDVRFSNGRLSAAGANGGCYSHDAQLFGVTSFGQGVSFSNTSFRLSGSAKYYIKLDRSRRHLFLESYGESVGTETGVISITSRTKSGGKEIFLLDDDISGNYEVDGVVVGRISQSNWHATRCITRIGADGRMANGALHAVNGPNSSTPLQLTSFHNDGLWSIGWDDGSNRVPILQGGNTFLRPEVALGLGLGTSTFPFAKVDAARVTYSGDLTIDPSGVLHLAGASLNAAFVLGDAATPVFRPLVGGGASLGTTKFLWQNGRFHNLYSDSGTVSVSDERKKTFGTIEEAERAAALEIKANIGKFQFNDAIEKKGALVARWHYGVGAQSVGEILRKHGIDPATKAFWCYDEWPAVEAKDAVPAVVDADGNEIKPAIPAVEPVEAGNQYGINYPELCMFILAAI